MLGLLFLLVSVGQQVKGFQQSLSTLDDVIELKHATAITTVQVIIKIIKVQPLPFLPELSPSP